MLLFFCPPPLPPVGEECNTFNWIKENIYRSIAWQHFRYSFWKKHFSKKKNTAFFECSTFSWCFYMCVIWESSCSSREEKTSKMKIKAFVRIFFLLLSHNIFFASCSLLSFTIVRFLGNQCNQYSLHSYSKIPFDILIQLFQTSWLQKACIYWQQKWK